MNKLNRTEIQKMMDAIKAFEKLQDEYRVSSDGHGGIYHQMFLLQATQAEYWLDLKKLRDALQEGEL